MVTEIRTLRVSAEMDASQYSAAASQKQAADKGMAASGKQAADGIRAVGDAVAATDTKVSQAGNGIERLKRQFVTGYAASVDFERSLKTVGIGLDKGKLSAEQAASAVENLTRKYGQVANAAELAERGQLDLSRAVAEANTRMAAQVTTADHAALAQRRMTAANENNAGGDQAAQFRRQNLGFQLQDIGVSLYGGMPITTVLAQQGSQIAGIYAGAGGVNAALKDFGAMIALAARYLGPFVIAATAAYGAFQLLKSYSVEATLAVSEATKALAAQAAPLGTLEGQITQLTSLQETYSKAIADTARQSTTATSMIIANTEREFNARKALLELEEKRQQALIQTQRAEVAIMGNQLKGEVATSVNTKLDLERRGFADPRVGRFVNSLPDDLTGLDKTRSVLENSPLTDKIKELKANLELTELGAQKLEEALKKTFDTTPYGDGTLPIIGPVPGKNPRYDLNEDIDKETTSAASKFEKAVEKFAQSTANFTADIQFERQQLDRSPIDQVVASRQRGAGLPVDLNSRDAANIREIENIKELREEGKGFLTDLVKGLRGGEKIGEAFGKAFLDGLSRAADKQLDRLIDSFMSWLFPASSGGSPAASGTGVVGSIIGAANDNKTFANPVGAVTRAALPSIGSTQTGIPLSQITAAGGLTAKVSSEYAGRFQGLLNDLDSAGYPVKSLGEGGYSYRNVAGTNKLSKHSFGEALDINPRQNPWSHNFQTDMPSNINDLAKKNGLTWGGTWNKPDTMHFQVDKTAKALDGLDVSAKQVTGGLGGLGQSLASIPQALMASGGGSGILSGLTKYGMGIFGGSSQFAGAMMSGGIGLYADGTDSAPGGLAMVGERGRELVNLPRGSQVIPNHRTESLMGRAANNNGGRMAVDVGVSVDNGGNLQAYVKSVARATSGAEVGQRFADFGDMQRRGGVNDLNRKYASQKA